MKDWQKLVKTESARVTETVKEYYAEIVLILLELLNLTDGIVKIYCCKARKGLGDFQILINNAATQPEQPSLLKLSVEQLENIFNANIFSIFYITKASLPSLKRGATIVNCT